ncbi:MAG: enoyl-CoA hydratase-related protein [Chloroflexota bacterium]|nr:enoyl-CoA hydratase-related protein [Chloroflexota bacterium]
MSKWGGFKWFDIEVEEKDKIATITLNRPDKLNAMHGPMLDEMGEVFAKVGHDLVDTVNAVILTGAGRGFSAGGDVKMFDDRASGRDTTRTVPLRTGWAHFVNLLGMEQPVVTAVNGDAIGLGATIALLGDVVIASDRARFADMHVRAGLVAGDGGAVLWPLLMGINRAKEYLMTGDLITAPEAKEMGLVNKVVPHDQLMPTARAMALRLANGPKWAIRWTKWSVNKILRERVNLILDTSLALEHMSFHTEDHNEAARAFVEKRAPRYTGKLLG